MSANEQTALAGEVARASGKTLSRKDALSMKGGGVVFPKGVGGCAFYLDERSFIRYCTEQDEREHRERELEARVYGFKDMKVLAFYAAIYLSCTTLIGIMNRAGLASITFYAALCVLYICARLHRSFFAPGWFYSAFPNVRPLPFLKQWSQVARLDNARDALNALWLRAWRVAALVLLAGGTLITNGEWTIQVSLALALLGLAALEGLISAAFLFVYLPIRLGWKFPATDLEPV